MVSKLRIAIIECDNPGFSSINKRGNYGGIFTSLLKEAAPLAGLTENDLQLSVHNVVENTTDYPNLEDIDGILMSGSKYNSYDDIPWINRLVAFNQEILHQDRVRIIGVCFGHQIIGRAMGVKVAPSNRGWEVSVSKMELSEKGKELFKKEHLQIMQMHGDIVYDYPPLVEPLGRSHLCEVQGMYIPQRLISVQGHPEFTEEIMGEILAGRYKTGLFDKHVYEDGMSRAGKKQDGVEIAAAFLRFMLEGR